MARLINPDGTEVKNKLCKSAGTFIPVKKQYEKVNGIFVPVYYDGYILYNSLTTDGSAWLDLGHVGDSTHRYELDFSTPAINDTNNYAIFGDRQAVINRELIVVKTYNNTIDIRLRNANTPYVTNISPTVSHRIKASVSKTKYVVNVDGTIRTTANVVTVDFTTPNNLAAFKIPGLPSTMPYPNLSFRSIKEYGADDTLLYEYVPAKRQSDNVLGMLEVVNGTFHTNAGSGAFTIS